MTIAAPSTFDPATTAGKVRLLIPDCGPDFFFFSDAQISAYLSLSGNAVRLAAADAVETIARNTAMVDKVIETLDIKTDGAKVADALLKQAESLRKQYDLGVEGLGVTEYGDLTIFNRLEYFDKTGQVVESEFFGGLY